MASEDGSSCTECKQRCWYHAVWGWSFRGPLLARAWVMDNAAGQTWSRAEAEATCLHVAPGWELLP
eukprot:16436120-Heterocapsa_arctica.AAC.1